MGLRNVVFDGLIFGAGGPRVDRGRLSLVFGSGYYLKTMMCDVQHTLNRDIRQWWQIDITGCCFPFLFDLLLAILFKSPN